MMVSDDRTKPDGTGLITSGDKAFFLYQMVDYKKRWQFVPEYTFYFM